MNTSGFFTLATRGSLIRRACSGSLAVAIALTLAIAAHADTSDPTTVAKTLVNQALAVLSSNLPLREKQERLRGVVKQSFDFTEMSRSALGYHWRNLTPDQQQDFTRVFTQFIEDSYLSKISDYKGQTVTFTKTIQLAPGYIQVNSKVIQPTGGGGGEPISLNYRLKYEGGQWKIYDVTVDAISIIANYRNQFNRVINDKGFPTLMTDLRAKSTQLANALGES